MPYGRRTPLRSHRRRGTRRRQLVAPWVVVALLAVVATSGLSAGYVLLMRQSCAGEVRATVVAAPGLAPMIEELARSWVQTQPAVGGACAHVDVEARESAVVAQQLGAGWDERTGVAPTVWLPETSAWARRAAVAAAAEALLPERQPSVARSPTVIAMPRPMAEALGWPAAPMSWRELIERHAAGPGWAAAGHPQWGEFRLGMSDPLRSTAGLHALLAVVAAGDEQGTVTGLRQVHKVYEESTQQLLANLRLADARGGDAALRYVSAFPALEQEVLAYNAGQPRVPLVAVHPSDGSTDADHPYLILDAAWSDGPRRQVAQGFLDYLRGPAGRAEVLSAGFRDANRAGGNQLVDANGTVPRVAALPRAFPLPESVTRAVELWTALTRRTKVLLVLDVSGSMGEPVHGTAKTRLGVLADAVRGVLTLLPDDAEVGLWVYASRLDGSRDHRQVVAPGALREPGDAGRPVDAAGRTRREALAAALDRLTPGGNTGLYDTAVAGQQAVLGGYRDGATNLVLLVTDGENDDDTGGLGLVPARELLIRGTANPGRRVPVVTVGLGADADVAALRELSRATGAVSYRSAGGFDLAEVLLTAVLGRV